MHYSAFSARKSILHYRKINIITMIIFYIALLFPICAIMFSVQLEKSISESVVKYLSQTIVCYTEEFKFTNEDMDKIKSDNLDIVDFIVPMDSYFQNAIIGEKYRYPVVLTTNKDFLKVNNMLLNNDFDIMNDEGTTIILGKSLVKNNMKEIELQDGIHKVDGITYNYLYSGYVIRFEENVSSFRIEIVLKNNNESSKNEIIQYMLSNFDGYIALNVGSNVMPTVTYQEDFLSKAIKITAFIALYSLINILSILTMKFDEEKKSIAVRFAMGARRGSILFQNLLEQLFLFSIAAITALASLPMIVTIINTNLSFIRLHYDLDVILFTMGVVIACACFFSFLFSLKLKYKKIIVNIKG